MEGSTCAIIGALIVVIETASEIVSAWLAPDVNGADEKRLRRCDRFEGFAESLARQPPKWACCLRRLERFGAHFLAFSTLPIILIFIERAGAVSAHPPALGDHRETPNG